VWSLCSNTDAVVKVILVSMTLQQLLSVEYPSYFTINQ